jgi:hypothetical protein
MASGVDLESGRNSSGTTPLDDYAAGNLALVRCSSSPAAQGASSEPEYTRADDIEANAAVHALSSRAEPPMRSRPISLRHVPRARAWSHQQCSICVEAFVLDDEVSDQRSRRPAALAQFSLPVARPALSCEAQVWVLLL